MNIIDANPNARKKLQYTREELLGASMKQLFYHDPEATRFFEEICSDDAIVQQEFTFRDKSGKKISVLVNANKLDEQLGTFLCVAEDITDKKREELEKDNRRNSSYPAASPG